MVHEIGIGPLLLQWRRVMLVLVMSFTLSGKHNPFDDDIGK